MKLREVIDSIMTAKEWDQTALGKEVGAPQSMVSRMRKGDDWEQHWQTFLKLLPLCKDAGIDPARDLEIADATEEGVHHVEREVDKETRRAVSRTKRKRKKKAVSPIPTRRAAGN